LHDNAVLARVDGFSNLQFVGSDIQVYNNAAMSSLSGFAGLSLANRHIEVYNNAAMTSLSGFQTVSKVLGHLKIQDNASLATITGFGMVTEVGAEFQIYHNQALTAFDSMVSLKSVGSDLIIKYNNVLTSLNGLISSPLQSVGNDFSIANNPSLSSCTVDYLRQILKSAGAWSNVDDSCCNLGCTTCTGAVCTTPDSTGTGGQVGTYVGSVVLNTAADAQTMAGVTEIQGDLTINSTSLTSLTGLDHLTHQSPHGYAAENCCRDGSCLRAEADPYGVEMPAHSELVWDFAQLDVDNKLARVRLRPPARQLPFGRDR